MLNLLILPSLILAQYNPHQFPIGTFFEGWFTRFSSSNSSVGLIIGSANTANDNTLISLLVQTLENRKLVVLDGRPRSIDINSCKPEPCFDIKATGKDVFARISVRPTLQSWNVSIGDFTFVATTRQSLPWHNGGPEGFVYNLPFVPLHWYVESIGSVAEFRLTNRDKVVLESGKGSAHLEKNWGSGFPSKWIWAQAVDADSDTQIIVSGGSIVKFVPDVFLILIRVRGIAFSPTLGKVLFRWEPHMALLNPLKVSTISDSAFSVSGNQNGNSFHLEISAPFDSFEFVKCPTGKGFVNYSVESFAALFKLDVNNKNGKSDKALSIGMGALEFGGELAEKFKR